MTHVQANGPDVSRPVSLYVERLLSRLPRSFASMIAGILIIKSAARMMTVGIAKYVTHEQLPTTLLWDGSLKVENLVVMLLLAPPIETFVLLLSAFVVSWFSPLSPARATLGQVMIGVGLIFGVLEAAITTACFLRGIVHGVLYTFVYLRYRDKSRLTGAGMVLPALFIQNCIGAGVVYSIQRWSP